MLKLSGVVLDKEMNKVCGADYFLRKDPSYEALKSNETLEFLNPMEPLLRILGKPKDDIDNIIL
jgi:hypothetical protein